MNSKFQINVRAEPRFEIPITSFLKETDTELKNQNISPPGKWTCYNNSQINEIELFEEFLYDLVNTVENEENGFGRPKTPIQDLLYCSIQKTYNQLSLRREQTVLRRAAQNNKISCVPGINGVSAFLNRPEVTPVLRELLRLSASPMASIEENFAVDSSGFRTTTYSEWCKEKHRTGKKNEWLKAHISTGVITNIVADMVVTGGHSADTIEFIPLMEGTLETFDVKRVTGDKGYLSRKNYDMGKIHGFEVFIPFKSNVTGKQRGSKAWFDAFYFFKNHEDEFMKIYHERSNVEATFGAIKKKMGDSLKSKNRTAQINELYCKIIAYNITMVIRGMYLNGIDVCFNREN
jgi:Transposase DDE domain.